MTDALTFPVALRLNILHLSQVIRAVLMNVFDLISAGNGLFECLLLLGSLRRTTALLGAAGACLIGLTLGSSGIALAYWA